MTKQPGHPAYRELGEYQGGLSASPAGNGQPVAWRYELAHATSQVTGNYADWRWHLSETEPHVPKGSIRNLTPLFALTPARGFQGERAAPEIATGDAVYHASSGDGPASHDGGRM